MLQVASNIVAIVLLCYGVVNIIAGSLGMILYGVFTKTFGPVFIMNQFIGLWLTSAAVFFALLLVWQITTLSLLWKFRVENVLFRRICSVGTIIYFVIVLLESFLLFLGFAIGKRIDAIIWSLVLIALNIANVVALANSGLIVTCSNAENDPHVSLEEGATKSASRIGYCCYVLLEIVLVVCEVAAMIVMLLLIIGAMTLANGVVSYGPGVDGGKVMTFTMSNGRSQSVYFKCDGPKNASFPVIVFEADGSHGIADFYGLQNELTLRGRRSCIFDKPGLGWSDYLYQGEVMTDFYHPMITGLQEKAPFIFAGWGGGGEVAYEYALEHPEMVHSIVMMDTAKPGVEWDVPARIYNWTTEQATAYKNADLQGRNLIFNIINGIGVPFGLMGIFIPPSKSFPSSLAEQRRWFFLTEKTWTTQKYWLDLMIASNTNPFVKPLNASIPINLLLSALNETTVREAICNKQNLSAERCDYEIKWNQLLYQGKLNIVANRHGGQTFTCWETKCNLGFWVEGETGRPSEPVNWLLSFYK